MKFSIWIIAAAVLTVGIRHAAAKNISRDPVKTPQENVRVEQIQTEQVRDQPFSAEVWAEVIRKEFVGRLTDLRDWESDLDRQVIALDQEISDLQSQIEYNRLELERVRVDQKDVQRNIKELEREKDIFDKKDELRKKTERLQSGK
ncbi:hypothetical protein EHM69_06610 [candidate division KSB1 bacterium]|nr:MAG: hypothetical protein EHM69_06610 [candidate division KSB1 bacterium]